MIRFVPLVISLLLINACSLLPENKDDYQKSKSNPKLEEPPEISLPTNSAAYNIPKSTAPKLKTNSELPSADSTASKLSIERDGTLRWLAVPLPADKVWSEVLGYFKHKDIKLAESDAKLAMLETEWLESKAGIPTEGLKGLLDKAVGSGADLALRDKYHLRVRAEGDSSKIFLTHRGAVLSHAKGDTPHWEMRQPEPEREAEMLRRIQLFLSHN